MKRVILLTLGGVLILGCGVRIRDPEPGTEFFSGLEVSGDFGVAAPLTLTVEFEQNYPTEVEVVCELRQNEQTLRELGRDIVPPAEEGGPEATPIAGHTTIDFTIDTAGDYVVECLTPKDEDNYIAEEISVSV